MAIRRVILSTGRTNRPNIEIGSMGLVKRAWTLLAATTLQLISSSVAAQAQAITGSEKTRGNREGHLSRSMRYQPDDGAFRIEDGSERFNRSLYGGNTAFRVDGGDKPEFVLYLPGRGGNLRLAVRMGGHVSWLHDSRHIVTRYLPGELRYEVSDPAWGKGVIRLTVVGDYATEGLILKAEATSLPAGVELLWAFGGVSGERGKRDGDIGTEAVPISQWFQPRAIFAEGNHIASGRQDFTVDAPAATLKGTTTGGSIAGIGCADNWNDPSALFSAVCSDNARPLVTGKFDLGAGAGLLSIQVLAHGQVDDLNAYKEVSSGVKSAPLPQAKLLAAYQPDELSKRFSLAEKAASDLRKQLRVITPDPYLNTAVAAMNVSADANWDGPSQSIMHGAIAWRTRLLGWRGPYALDALGWHDRAAANLRGWFGGQDVSPVPSVVPPPDVDSNLSRSEAALHSNGDLSHSHYDMNAVFIDVLLRHLAWTGDLSLAREAWPVITRHLAWERRLFRRTYDASGLPLYDSYAQIWASDDIYYNGGGTAYGSAYNVYANRQAARIASLIGEDPRPYEQEADAIAAGMRRFLWLPQRGMFGEYKDVVGDRMVHPDAGLWSFYHTVDSEVPTAAEAWSMTGAMLSNLPRLPVEGPGVPKDDHYAVYSTTDWMPYTWSVNNVVTAENAHAALALWQAHRPSAAYRLTKSLILANMYMGISPGNVGMANYLDVYRREAQRDFADGSGALSRAVVEGLFGLRPDALAGRLAIEPGLPEAWSHATIEHKDVLLDYKRRGSRDEWRLTQASPRFHLLCWRLPVRSERLIAVTVNGHRVAWRVAADAIGRPAVLIDTPTTGQVVVALSWAGKAVAGKEGNGALVKRKMGQFEWWAPDGKVVSGPPEFALSAQIPPQGPQEPVALADAFNERITALFGKGKYVSPRGQQATLGLPSQGLGAWAGHVNDAFTIDDSGLRAIAAKPGGGLHLPDGGQFALGVDAGGAHTLVVSQWANYPVEKTIPLSGSAKYIRLLMAGTTNAMQSHIDNGEVVVRYTDGTQARLPLHNPTSWWPIDADYLIDDYQFRSPGERPLRLDLKTGLVRRPTGASDSPIAGGSATILGLPLDPQRTLQSLTVRALAQDVIIATLAATLIR